MAAILVQLRRQTAGGQRFARAFEVARSRLRSRCGGPVRTGETACVRWAAIAGEAELAASGERLSVADAAPFMVEPGPPAGGTGVTVDLRSVTAELTRDVFGAKPLFYMMCDGGWVIASEAKLLTPFLSGVSLNRVALSDVVRYRWILGEDYLAEPIRQVLPGAAVRLVPGEPACRAPQRRIAFMPEDVPRRPFEWYCRRAEEVLRSSVWRAAEGAGEVAVLLSGGIDSAVLAALAKDEGLPVRAYVVRYDGYPNPEYDRAMAVAGWLRLPVEEVKVAPDALRTWLPELVWRLEQPPRHPNNVAVHRLLTAVRERTGVVVHGDGAEIMFGLADHGRVAKFARKRRVVRLLFGGRDRPGLRRRLAALGGARGARLARLLELSEVEYARRLDAIDYAPEAVPLLNDLLAGRDPCRELSALMPEGRPLTHEDLQRYQMYTFQQCSLVRLDRLAAPLGVSVALPFLGRDVQEFASRLPSRFKVRAGRHKPILREICARYVPAAVRWRKLGFATPDRAWVMGPVTPWVGELFRPSASAVATLLPSCPLEKLLDLDDHEVRWLLLTLEITLRHLGERDVAEPFGVS